MEASEKLKSVREDLKVKHCEPKDITSMYGQMTQGVLNESLTLFNSSTRGTYVQNIKYFQVLKKNPFYFMANGVIF